MNQENEITASSTETQVKSISERKRFASGRNERPTNQSSSSAGC
jgi:hypothetical protein